MLNTLSKNEMNILVILFNGEADTPSTIQQVLKPKIKGSIPAFAGIICNIKHLVELGLVKREKGKALYLTTNGKYYAELLDKLESVRA